MSENGLSVSRAREHLTPIDPPGRGPNKLSSWYVDGTSTTLALSAPDGWTKVLLGTLLAAVRAKALLFATYRDERRSVDSMVVMWRVVRGNDGREKWDWMIKRGDRTKVADVSDQPRGSACSERSVSQGIAGI